MKRTMKMSSILSLVSNATVLGLAMDIPFFCHHKQALNQEALGDLRTNSLEETR